MSDNIHYRILVAEDDPGLRRSLSSLLEAAGYAVVTAEHGVNAIFLLEKNVPDILIYELDLPQISGHDFLALVRTCFPQTSVIAISSSIDGNHGSDGVPHKVFADAICAKDHITPDVLLATISELVKCAKAKAKEHQTNGLEAFLVNQRARRTAA